MVFDVFLAVLVNRQDFSHASIYVDWVFAQAAIIREVEKAVPASAVFPINLRGHPNVVVPCWDEDGFARRPIVLRLNVNSSRNRTAVLIIPSDNGQPAGGNGSYRNGVVTPNVIESVA